MTATEDTLDVFELLAEGTVEAAGRAVAEMLRPTGARPDDLARFRELIEGVWWSRQADRRGLDRTRELVDRVVRHARDHGLAAPVLGYVRIVCEAAWELSWDHGPITEVIGSAAAACLPNDHAGDTVGDPVDAAALAALELLRHELRTESACSTGLLDVVVREAHRGHRAAEAAHRLAAAVAASGPRTWLAGLTLAAGARLEAIGRAADAARTALGEGPVLGEGPASGSGSDLAGTLDFLRRVEDADETGETRAHRAALEAIAAGADRARLRVDVGTVTHVVPFGLRGADPVRVVATVREHGAGWVLGGRALANRPTSLLLVDDIWRGEDPLHRRYEGTQLDLPDVVVDVDGDRFRMTVSLVVSQIGNHHLRFELPLAGAGPHVVAAAQQLSMPEYGNLHELGGAVRFAPERSAGGPGPAADGPGITADGPGWPRLVDLAARCLGDLVTELASAGLPTRLSFRPGMFHVITEVHRASAVTGGGAGGGAGGPEGGAAGEVTLSEPAELAELFGGNVLSDPLPAGVGSLADWAVDPAAAVIVVPTAIAVGTLLSLTANHTLIASFQAPRFMVGSVREVVDFSVSLEGLFAGWQDQLSEFQAGLRAHMEAYPHAGSLTGLEPAHAEGIVEELEAQHLQLRRFVNGARTSLLFIGSPALVSSPVVRETLNAVLAVNPVWSRRSEFTESAGQALSERYEEILSGWNRRRTETREARNRVMVETLLAVVAGIGISGIAALMQEGFGMKGWWDTLWLVIAVVVLAALIGLLAYRWTHAPSGQRRRRSAGAGQRHRSGQGSRRGRGHRSSRSGRIRRRGRDAPAKDGVGP